MLRVFSDLIVLTTKNQFSPLWFRFDFLFTRIAHKKTAAYCQWDDGDCQLPVWWYLESPGYESTNMPVGIVLVTLTEMGRAV